MQEVTRKKLGAGVGLTCVTTPKFKRAVLRAALLLPLGGPDAANRAALPHILRRGTAKLRDLRAISAALGDLYGARIEAIVRREGESVAIGFLADCIRDEYAPGAERLTEKSVQLLCDMLYDPFLLNGFFSEAYTACERANLLDRIAAQMDDPRMYALLRLRDFMCADELYGQPTYGTTKQAEAITAEGLYAAYRRALEDARIELFYCGAMPPDNVAALFAATLPERENSSFYVPMVEVIPEPKTPPREYIETKDVTQGKLAMGFRTGGICMASGDSPAYRMFQVLYGGSTSSKLFLNVREKQSLCYYVNAQFAALKGLMIVNSGIENEKYDVAKAEILRQLELCQKGDFSDTEMEAARQTLINGWRALLDDPFAQERYWLEQAAAGTHVLPEEQIDQIRTVSRDRVTAAACATALDTAYFMKGAARQ